jgi:hypothetical protein
VVVFTGLRCRCVRVGQGFGGFSRPAWEGLFLNLNTVGAVLHLEAEFFLFVHTIYCSIFVRNFSDSSCHVDHYPGQNNDHTPWTEPFESLKRNIRWIKLVFEVSFIFMKLQTSTSFFVVVYTRTIWCVSSKIRHLLSMCIRLEHCKSLQHDRDGSLQNSDRDGSLQNSHSQV